MIRAAGCVFFTVVFLVSGCAVDDSDPSQATFASATQLVPPNDSCGRSEDRLWLVMSPDLRCACSQPSCFFDQITCGPMAYCDPLLGGRCNGQVTLPAHDDGSCLDGTYAGPDGCTAQVPRRCVRDDQCPIGSFCDRAAGGVCDVACLPSETCQGATCCSGNTTCGCDGRCQGTSAQLAQPSPVVPRLTASPVTLEFIRRQVEVPLSPQAISIGLSPATPDTDLVRVTASRGLEVKCGDDSQYAQSCDLHTTASSRVAIHLAEPAGTAGDAAYSIELRHTFGRQVLTETISVFAGDPKPVDDLPLQGHYSGTIAVTALGVSAPGQAITVAGTGRAFHGELLPIEAEVWSENDPITGALRVYVTFIDDAHVLTDDGVITRIYDTDPTAPQSGSVAVAGDDDRPFLRPVAPVGDDDRANLVLEQVATQGAAPLAYVRSSGKLIGTLGALLRGATSSDDPTTPVPYIGAVFELVRDGELAGPGMTVPPTGQPSADDRPLEWAVHLRDVFDPSAFESWHTWLEHAGNGTVVSCGPGIVASDTAFEYSCRQTIAGTDPDAVAMCASVLESIKQQYFAGEAAPYDERIFSALYVPCIAGPDQPFDCLAPECTLNFSVEIPAGPGWVTVGACRIDAASLDPASMPSTPDYSTWLAQKAQSCANRLIAYSPADALAPAADMHPTGAALPVSGDLTYASALQASVIPGALGLNHQADRLALGQLAESDQLDAHELYLACFVDLTRKPPSWTYTSETMLAGRLGAVFATQGCIGLPQVMGSLAWLAQAPDDLDAQANFVRRLQQLVQAAQLMTSFDSQELPLGRLLAEHPSDSSDPIAQRAAQLPPAPDRLDAVTSVLELLFHPVIYSHLWQIGAPGIMAADYRSSVPGSVGPNAPSFGWITADLMRVAVDLRTLHDNRISGAPGLQITELALALARGIQISAEEGGWIRPTSGFASATDGAMADYVEKTPQKPEPGFEDPLHFYNRAYLPIYFVDPQGENSRFFATSDYILDHWAKPAVESAKAALAKVRADYGDLYDSKVQQDLAALDPLRQKIAIATQAGERIASLCGIDTGTSDAEGPYTDVFYDFSAHPEKASPGAHCYLDDAQVVREQPLRTCAKVIEEALDLTNPHSYEDCVGYDFSQTRHFKKMVCTFATFMADSLLQKNKKYFDRDKDCQTLDGNGGDAYGPRIRCCRDAEDEEWFETPKLYRDPLFLEYMPQWYRNHGPEKEKDPNLYGSTGLPWLLQRVAHEIADANVDGPALSAVTKQMQNYNGIKKTDIAYPSLDSLVVSECGHYAWFENDDKKRLVDIKDVAIDGLTVPDGWRGALAFSSQPKCGWFPSGSTTVEASNGPDDWFTWEEVGSRKCQIPKFFDPGMSATVWDPFWQQVNGDVDVKWQIYQQALYLGSCDINPGFAQMWTKLNCAAYGGCYHNEVTMEEYLCNVEPRMRTLRYDREWAAALADRNEPFDLMNTNPNGCQAFFQGRRVMDIYESCSYYIDEHSGHGANAPLPTHYGEVKPQELSSCLHGELGQQLLQILSAREQVRLARANLDQLSRSYDAQTRFCVFLSKAAEKVHAASEALNIAAEAQMTTNAIVDGILGSLGTIASETFTSGTLGAASTISNLIHDLDDSVQKAEIKYRTVLQQVQSETEQKSCVLEAQRVKFTYDANIETVRASLIDVAAALQRMGQLQQDLQNTTRDGTTRLEMEQAMGQLQTLIRQSAHSRRVEEWQLDVGHALDRISWAMRLVELARRALNYEAQASIQLDLDGDLVSSEDWLTELKSPPMHPADLDRLVHALELEQATRSINGARPEENTTVLSLRDDGIAIADLAADCAGDACAGEHTPDPTTAFQTRMLDPDNALYADDGTYLGQAFRFSLTPDLGMQYRCAERLWRVNATVVGDLLGSESPSLPVYVLKRNTFSSQWCEGHDNGVSPNQDGTWQPLVNLFRSDSFLANMDRGDAYSWAEIQAWTNIPRSELYKEAYREGASEELAGRGLYGEYYLLFPWHGLLDQGIAVENIEDVLLRFDYLSVNNGSAVVGTPGEGSSFGQGATLLPNGATCFLAEQCSSQHCAHGVCCDTACDDTPCKRCDLLGVGVTKGICSPVPLTNHVSGCGEYAVCDISGSCATSCHESSDCSEGFFCNPYGACSAKSHLGNPCDAPDGCEAGLCTGGTCCTTPCTSECTSCANPEGQCKPVVKGTADPDACGFYKCADGGSCAKACGNDADCNGMEGGACLDGKCVATCSAENPCPDDGDPCTVAVCTFVGACATADASDGTSCSDGDACTSGDACDGGLCAGGAPLSCDDANPCTDDSCDPAEGCQYSEDNANVCDDGNACTTQHLCKNGVCEGGVALDCEDGNGCTDDACNPGSGCTHASNALPCTDGDECTMDDACSAGACAGGAASSCDDGNSCTDDGCDAALGCTHVSSTASCDDSNACTGGDVCASGACTAGAPIDCDDGDACTIDSCLPESGCAHDDVSCDDGNVCTDDTCAPASGCAHADNQLPCTDGSACTTNDTCAAGACAGGAAPDCDDLDACTADSCVPETGCQHAGTPCDDANVCTEDGCDAGSGCTHTNNAVTCDDGSACTTSDTCSGGTCVGGAAPECSDGNECTDDGCDAGSGCTHTSNTASCDDVNACTSGDTCASGSCVGGAPPDCDDSDLCTSDSCVVPTGCAHGAISCDDGNVCTTDGCDAQTGCTHTNNTTSCDDGDACTTNDTCAAGACAGGAAPDCDDSNACTSDSCAPATGCVHGNVSCDDANVCTTDGCDAGTGCTHTSNTVDCSDGNACTTADACASGSCVGGAAPDCGDGNTCTDDDCIPATGCTHASNSASCDDGNACTTNDTCSGGSCAGGTAPSCDDSDACTADSCAPASGCEHSAISCTDGNVCTDDGCDPATGCTHADNTAGCDDGNACTTADTCVAGACEGGPPPSCDDSDACTTDSCVPATGCTHAGASCDDANVCTTDGCDAQAGCTHADNTAACSDGNACTTSDVCSGGSCVGGAAPDCGDGNVCTDDGCDAGTGCTHAGNAASCDDGNACTTNDTCSSGSCTGGAAPSCDDADACTSDSCAPASGCEHAAISCSDDNVCTDDSCDTGTGCTHANNTAACDDGNACTTADTCDSGTCVGGAAPSCDDSDACTADSCVAPTGCVHGVISCDDANVCTEDACIPATGCTHSSNAVSCTDGSLCTTDDACSGGACVGGPALSCDDGNACTTDSCDPGTGCAHSANTIGCEDGDACTTGDTCSGGSCAGGAATDCDDDNACTTDGCVPPSGCTHDAAPRDGHLCVDGNACTILDVCAAGGCVPGVTASCDDFNVCTSDACEPASGCVWTSTTAACDDGDVCTSDDTCTDGACLATPYVCDDGNPCTNDACDGVGGCSFAGTSGACNDGVACTKNDVCALGQCHGTAYTCTDGNPCTNDGCDGLGECLYTSNTAACDDGNPCTVSDACAFGGCKPGSAANCDDTNPCTLDSCAPATGCVHTDATAGAPCDATCMECNGSGSCVATSAGQDPFGDCADASCSAATFTPEATCDGTGACDAPASDACAGGFACQGSVCGTTCANSSECASSHYCSAAACVPKKAASESCTAPEQCQSDSCSGGVCQ